MRQGWRLVIAAVVAAVGLGGPAEAVEYRLRLVNLHEGAFASFLTANEWKDGASGPGLARLESSLDRGDIGKGNLLYDRHLQPAREAQARAYGGVAVAAAVVMGGGDGALWDEVHWEGQPGEQSIWVVRPTSRLPQALIRTALKGTGPLRQFQPYGVPSGSRVDALRIPLGYLAFGEERGTLWQKDLAARLDLSRGIGVVVGTNDDLAFPDTATIVVKGAAEPTTYAVVLVWRLRDIEQQAPGRGIRRLGH
jgi:hypothetical protein